MPKKNPSRDWLEDVHTSERSERNVRERARAIIAILIICASALGLGVAIWYRTELGEWGLPAGFLLGSVIARWMTPVIRHYFPSRYDGDEELDSL